MLKLALLWLKVRAFSPSGRATLLREAILVSCFVLGVTCFISKIVLDAHFIDTRPRESQPAEGRLYPQRLKAAYGATVYLTQNEKILSDLLLPTSILIMAVGMGLNQRWKLHAPYKESKWDGPFNTKRKPPD